MFKTFLIVIKLFPHIIFFHIIHKKNTLVMCFIKHTKSTPPKKAIKELITYIMASFLSDIHKDANFQHTKLEVTHGVVSMVKPRWIVQ